MRRRWRRFRIATGVRASPRSKSAEDELAKLEAKTAGRLTEPRVYHTATKLDDGRVLIAGSKGLGTMSMPGPPIGSAEIFDPEMGDWVSTAPMSKGREHHEAVLLGDGKVLVTGGRGPISYCSPPRFSTLQRAHGQ